MKRVRWLTVPVLVLLVLAGCAKPPESKIEEARAALSAAEDADAAQYAPDALKEARDARDQLDAELEAQSGKFFLFRGYRNAGALADQIIAAANRAVSETESRKERLRAEVNAALADLGNLLKSARLQLGGLPVTAPVNRSSLRSRLDTAEQQIGQAQNERDGQRFDAAMATVSRAREAIAGVLREIERVTVRTPSKKR